MSVDFPAPFSPIRACTSPGNIRKSTPSSATTPGNSLRMPVISRTARGSVITGRPRLGSVLALRQGFLGLRLVELGLLRLDASGDLLACGDLLDQIHELRSEQRVALDDVVDLAVGQGRHAVLDRVDRDDLDVRTGLLARGLDGFDGTEGHVVVVRVEDVDLALRLQEGLHDLLALGAGELTGLRGDDLDLRGPRDGAREPLLAVVRGSRTGAALEPPHVHIPGGRGGVLDEPLARLLALGHEVRPEEG